MGQQTYLEGGSALLTEAPLAAAVPPQGSLVTCEFLLQNGANVNLRDAHGRGPLHHATVLGHTG